MLIEKLGFPSTYKCDKYTPPINTGIAEYYLDDSRIPEIIQKRKKSHECAFWFMSFYQHGELKKGNTNILKQKKYGDENDVRFYSEEQTIELINTLHCQIQMMLLFKQSFCFDRNSSIACSFEFGQARVKCKDFNTLSMFLKSINDIENYSLNENNIYQ